MSAAPARSPSSGWDLVRAGDVLDLINGRAFKPAEWGTTGLPIVRIQNLNDPTAPFNYYSGELPAKFKVSDGELLFAWSGTPGTSFGAHIWVRGPAWLNQHIFRVLFDEAEFDKRFLRYAINRNLNEYIRLAHGGAGLAHITKGRFEDSLLLRPPIEEQRRIVASIEQQLTRLDAGVAALRSIQANLKRYRAAVLKAACEGRLVPTEAELARREGRPYEPASVLLERIKAEKAKLAGANVTAPSRRSTQRRDAAAALPADLPPLPEGWVSATLGSCFRVVVGATPSRKVPAYWAGDVPWVSSGEVQFCRIAATRECVTASALAECNVVLNPTGSVLLGMIGEGRTRGQAAILDVPAANNQNCAAIWVGQSSVLPEYVYWWLCHEYDRTRQIGAGNNQRALNKSVVGGMVMALPPGAEQRRIVAEVDRRLSLADALDGIVTANLHRATRLRHSILSNALSEFCSTPTHKRGSSKEGKDARPVPSQ
jgi:type I restriction enzyme S subunit